MYRLFTQTFDSKFDDVFKRVIEKHYRIDLLKYGFNKYSLIDEQVFIISNIIKKISDLIILIPDIEINQYIVLLKKIINDSNDISDLYYKMDDYLIERLIENYHSKDRIISYITDRYIDNGYCYHGFNSSFEESILSKGLNGDSEVSHKLKNMNNILENYGIVNAMTYNWSYKDNKSVFTTDNFGAAYYYSLLSPVLLSRFVSNGLYTYQKGYDNLAFYIRDSNGILDNVSKIMDEYHFSNEDRMTIISTVKEFIEVLFQDKDNLSIAFIQKKSIHRDVPINTCNLNIRDSIVTMLKPRYELDRHENAIFHKDMFRIAKVKNYTRLLKNFR